MKKKILIAAVVLIAAAAAIAAILVFSGKQHTVENSTVSELTSETNKKESSVEKDNGKDGQKSKIELPVIPMK